MVVTFSSAVVFGVDNVFVEKVCITLSEVVEDVVIASYAVADKERGDDIVFAVVTVVDTVVLIVERVTSADTASCVDVTIGDDMASTTVVDAPDANVVEGVDEDVKKLRCCIT